jgi:carboxymethylenebutenolidase
MPIDVAKDLKVPVIGFYGGLDQGIPLDSVQRMQDELKKGKSKSEIVVYPTAQHGRVAEIAGLVQEKRRDLKLKNELE